MDYYQLIMIALVLLGMLGSAVIFGLRVLRYLWRIEQAVELLVDQNKKQGDNNISFNARLRNLENIIPGYDTPIDFVDSSLVRIVKK